MRRGYIACRQK